MNGPILTPTILTPMILTPMILTPMSRNRPFVNRVR
jgi:hypothetical protein